MAALRERRVAGSERGQRCLEEEPGRGGRSGDAYFSGSEAFAGFRWGGFLGCWCSALTHGLVHDDGAGDGDVEGRNLSGHGDAEEMIAGLFDEVVETCAFAAEDEDAVGFEVEVGVVG